MNMPFLTMQALELGRRTPSLRGPIALIAGERGRWLGGRNAAWNLFATNAENELDPEVWDNGTLMQREAYLKSLRAQEPAKARERFETASASFDARERAAFTGCLGEGLSAADEALPPASSSRKPREGSSAASLQPSPRRSRPSSPRNPLLPSGKRTCWKKKSRSTRNSVSAPGGSIR